MKIIPLLFAATLGSLHAQTYTVTDLGATGGRNSEAKAINASGAVVGLLYLGASDEDNGYAAFFGGNPAIASNLNPLDEGNYSEANAINASGVIVGRANYKAARFGMNGAGNVNLGTLGGRSSTAIAVNASGAIVGHAAISNPFDEYGEVINHAVLFSGNGVNNIDLGTLDGGFYSSATAINGSGTIVGNSTIPTGEEGSFTRAVRFSGNGINNVDLGTLGGNYSFARAINASGLIVGAATTKDSDYYRATLFSGNGVSNTDLGALGRGASYAMAINASGTIVGYSDTPFDLTHAFVYRDGTMVDLNSLINTMGGIVLTKAVGINDAGQIAATGINSQGFTRAYRLDPITYLIKAKIKGKGIVIGGKNYIKGATVTLTAKPKKGSKFVDWTEGKKVVSKKKTYTFPATVNRTIVANFK